MQVNRRHLEAARRNVDRHLGDCFDPDETESITPEAISEEVWNLAFDGAKDAGADMADARAIADHVKREHGY